MNKKTLAVAALALIATSGLASAQTVRQQPRLEREARIINPPLYSNAAVYAEDERFGLNSRNSRRQQADDEGVSSNFFDWRAGANTN